MPFFLFVFFFFFTYDFSSEGRKFFSGNKTPKSFGLMKKELVCRKPVFCCSCLSCFSCKRLRGD